MADKCTALAVIDDAIETLAKPGGYTPEMYWGTSYRSDYDKAIHYAGADTPQEATAFCAIGGVEHSIWKLCDASYAELQEKRGVFAYVDSADEYNVEDHQKRRDRAKKPAWLVYIDVMGVLNRVAQSKSFKRYEVSSIEGLTGCAPKRTVMRAFRAARDEIAARP